MTQAGERLFNQYGCNTCHKPDESGKGPSLVGQFGKPQLLKDGRTLVVDETFIRQAITNPNSMPLPNYAPVMPTFQGQLNEEQILQLMAYVKSLGARTKGGK
jgi:cytochrome c oxidase subunit 2